MSLVLASASLRRHQLLVAAGIPHVVDPVEVDERQLPGELPSIYVERVAMLKAETGALRHPGRVVVGADTAVVLDGQVFGKPVDAPEATRMLKALAGRSHEVLTGVAVVGQGQRVSRVERTTVWFSPLTSDDVAEYVGTGEPMGKAGAYAIQGWASRFIPRVDGSYTNVVGLPLTTLLRLLARLDWPIRVRPG